MKMSQSQKKGGDEKLASLQAMFDKLQIEHSKLKEEQVKDQVSMAKSLKNLESRLDKLKYAQAKGLAPTKKPWTQEHNLNSTLERGL